MNINSEFSLRLVSKLLNKRTHGQILTSCKSLGLFLHRNFPTIDKNFLL